MRVTPPGLSDEEAAIRLREYGPNRLVPETPARRLKEVLALLADPMALMLAAAATIYLLMGETRDGVILLVALVPVLGIDILLEARSRDALKKLAEAVAPRARVIRAGREKEIAAGELVPGDIVVLREGDVLHADGVVLSSSNLSADESALTGESEPASKPPGERFFAGALVVAGQGLGEVQQTGGRTEFGRLAVLVAESRPEATPLERKTRQLVKGLAGVAAVVAIGVFALGVSRGQSFSRSFLTAISVAMAAIPEEFPLVFTLFLTLGAWRLSRRHVLVRKITSVETLGSTTVICTDKTGTLTTGEFTLDAERPLFETTTAELFRLALLACENPPADRMESAIVERARGLSIDFESEGSAANLAIDYDFDPATKTMAHLWRQRSGPWLVAAKGAVEGILQSCDVTAGERLAAEASNADLARRGFRVLAVAGIERDGSIPPSGTRSSDVNGLKLAGLVGFRDPVRPEVPAAIAECRSAGISVKLITGDHALTAVAIAEAAGIPFGSDNTVSGTELEELSPEEFGDRVRRASVLARIRPEQKHAIVESLIRDGEIVAMTGDGINDAPALRRASIGVSMGIRGTEVARSAADMVLLDDNFASIVAAVREGRLIFDNLQKSFLYLIAFHIPIVALALIVPLAGLPLLFFPVHLVWLELIVHPVSALIFEGEPPEKNLMSRPPRDPSLGLLPRIAKLQTVGSGALLTAAVLAAYAWRVRANETEARSLGMAVLVFGTILLILAERAGSRPWWRVAFPRTIRFWGILAAVAVSVPILTEVEPLDATMHLSPLTLSEWLVAGALAIASVGWRAFGLPLPPIRSSSERGRFSPDSAGGSPPPDRTHGPAKSP